MNTNVLLKKATKRISPKVQTLAAAIAIVAAVALPQLLHTVGELAGVGSALGEALLPMHLPILLVGLLAGPYAGGIAGVLAPLLSFALTGMPRAELLPFMMLELCVYGLCAGILRNFKMPNILKVLLVQLAGRAVRAVAILLSFYAFGSQAISPRVIVSSVITGLVGILLQWALLPLILYRVEHADRHAK